MTDTIDNGDGTIASFLPKTDVKVVARLLTGRHEPKIKVSKSDQIISKQLESIIVSVNDDHLIVLLDMLPTISLLWILDISEMN